MVKTKHDSDCHIYSSPVNVLPCDGICTCGYGLERLRKLDDSYYDCLVSEERNKRELLNSGRVNNVISECVTMLNNAKEKRISSREDGDYISVSIESVKCHLIQKILRIAREQ